ncbi:hypothetical protein DPMN_149931 [Dreissena polymorpha]|uniref:Uncharacterized protein n=1 Tax=Dreissena polymorpha TaxID=45954 RepID=A0A9D4FFD9_DREPO|nr:hypothetical protein DPMN_149931 [Dreissena polymorpha]
MPAAYTMVIIAGYQISSANNGLHRVLSSQQRTPWAYSRAAKLAEQPKIVSYTVRRQQQKTIIIAGCAVSRANIGHHRGLYRKHRTPRSSSWVIPSATQTMVIIAV